jgi:hypothetical protein
MANVTHSDQAALVYTVVEFEKNPQIKMLHDVVHNLFNNNIVDIHNGSFIAICHEVKAIDDIVLF